MSDAKPIEQVLALLTEDEANAIIGSDHPEYDKIAQAVTTWQGLFMAGVLSTDGKPESLQQLCGSAFLILATLIRWTYALGIQRGMRRRKRGRK